MSTLKIKATGKIVHEFSFLNVGDKISQELLVTCVIVTFQILKSALKFRQIIISTECGIFRPHRNLYSVNPFL